MKDINFFKTKDSWNFREVSSKAELVDLDGVDGILIRSSEAVARAIIASLRDRNREKGVGGNDFKVGIYGKDDSFNRRVLETLKIDYLVSPDGETGACRKDNVKQRDSGLNHVLGKIAKDKGVSIIVDMGAILKVGDGRLQDAKRIARIMQNVLVCRRAGCSLKIVSLGRKNSEVIDEKARRSFGVSLGMSSEESFDCVRL